MPKVYSNKIIRRSLYRFWHLSLRPARKILFSVYMFNNVHNIRRMVLYPFRLYLNIFINNLHLWYFLCILIEMIAFKVFCAMIRISNYNSDSKVKFLCAFFQDSVWDFSWLFIFIFVLYEKHFSFANKKIQLIFEALHDFHQFRHIRFIAI